MAILFGLLAACVWGSGNLAAARASRMMSPNSVLVGVSLIGLVICVPLLVVDGAPRDTSFHGLFWLGLGGAANIAGLGLLYPAYRSGDVAVVAPICSTEGAIAAVIAIAAGERVQAAVIVLLVVIVLGVIRVADASRDTIALAGRLNWGVVTVTCLSAACFGVSLYATGRASTREQFAWVAASPRIVGVVCVAIPMLALGRVRIARPAAPALALSAVCEVGGFILYSLAAHHSLAVAAVLGSLFAAFAVVGAMLLFGERMSRAQYVGVATIIVAVAALGAVTS